MKLKKDNKQTNHSLQLKQLKKNNRKAYDFLVFLSLFKNGLYERDLNQLELLNIIHKEWKDYLNNLLGIRKR